MNSHDKARVAVKALVSARSVDNYLHGRPMRATIEGRIRKAIHELRLSALDTRPVATTPNAQ